MDQEAQYRRESRDGIVWEHLPDQRLVRVKIQGSNELVVAWYPENWQKVPVFLKVGNAVRIAHVGGNRSRIEIVSHGLTVPTPVAGGMFPDMGAGADYWVSGGGMLSTETPSLRVRILPGTVRIDGVNYDLTFDPLMGDPMEMGDGVVIGSGIGIEEIDPPPDYAYPSWGQTAQYRYDAFVVGLDGVVDYLKGTETLGITGAPYFLPDPPDKPAIPAGHVLIGDYILVYSGMTEILPSDIGRIFSAPRVARLICETYSVMDWHDPSIGPPPEYEEIPFATNQSVSLWMADQYGNPAFRPGGGNYMFTLEFPHWIAGNGVIGQRSAGGTTLNPTIDPVISYGTYKVILNYERQNADGNVGYSDDVSPGLRAYVDYDGIRYDSVFSIKLLDENGLVMLYGSRVPL
jgi:hydrogenase maturation factor